MLNIVSNYSQKCFGGRMFHTQVGYENLGETGVLKITLPWITEEFDTTKNLMGDNFWKYGIEANRKELESIMRYVYDQGLVNKKVRFEELFDPTTMNIKE